MNIHKIKKYSLMAIRKIINHFQTEFFIRTGYGLPKPMRVYYLITNKCNYRCLMCPQWECGIKENPESYISETEMKKVIDEMVKLGIAEFGISGGEALIYRDKMFNLLAYANQKGLYTHFVTNGALLSEEVLQKYNDLGGGHVSLSLDAAGPEHDRLRGVPGAFGAVERTLKIFREKRFPNLVLKINTVLSGANLDLVVDVVKLAIAQDKVIFIQPYDVYDYAKKLTAEEKRIKYPLWVEEKQKEKLNAVVAELVALKKQHPQILLNEEKHLKSFYNYFVHCQVNQTCFAGIDQIGIGPTGKISFCKYGEIGDLRAQNLNDFLQSKKRREVVMDSLKCRHGCLLSCMFRPTLGEMLANGPKQFWKLIR